MTERQEPASSSERIDENTGRDAGQEQWRCPNCRRVNALSESTCYHCVTPQPGRDAGQEGLREALKAMVAATDSYTEQGWSTALAMARRALAGQEGDEDG